MKRRKPQLLLILTLAFALLAAATLPLLLVGGGSDEPDQKLTITYGVAVEGVADVKESILYDSTSLPILNNTVIPVKLLKTVTVSFRPDENRFVRIVSAETTKKIVLGRFTIDLGKNAGNESTVETINISRVREILEEVKKEAGISLTKHSIIILYTARYVAEKPGYEPATGTITARVIVEYDIAENVYSIKVDSPPAKIVLEKPRPQPQEEPLPIDTQKLALPLFLLGVTASPLTAYAYRREKLRENPYQALRARYSDIILEADEPPPQTQRVMVKDPWRLASLAEKTGAPLLVTEHGSTILMCVVQDNVSFCTEMQGATEQASKRD